MNMRFLFAVSTLLVILLVPQTARAQGCSPIPMGEMYYAQPLAEQMKACSVPRTLNVDTLNRKNLMVPMMLPVRMVTTNGRMTMIPLVASETMPKDTVMVPLSVPVKIAQAGNQTCLNTTLDRNLDGLLLLLPTTVQGKQLMHPVQVKREGDKLWLLPTALGAVKDGASVPVYADGQLMMIPFDCTMTADGVRLCPRSTPHGQINVRCP